MGISRNIRFMVFPFGAKNAINHCVVVFDIFCWILIGHVHVHSGITIFFFKNHCSFYHPRG